MELQTSATCWVFRLDQAWLIANGLWSSSWIVGVAMLALTVATCLWLLAASGHCAHPMRLPCGRPGWMKPPPDVHSARVANATANDRAVASHKLRTIWLVRCQCCAPRALSARCQLEACRRELRRMLSPRASEPGSSQFGWWPIRLVDRRRSLAWLVKDKKITPHVPVFNKSNRTAGT
jgi:hypothetical protein